MNGYRQNLPLLVRCGATLATCAIVLVALSLGAAALAQTPSSEPTPPPSTSLGVMVVTPTQSVAPVTAKSAATIAPPSLDLKLNIAPPQINIQTPKVGAVQAEQEAKPKQAPVRTPPRALHIVSPAYPPQALAQELRGSVTLRFSILPDGQTGDIEILSSTPRDVFDQVARDAVSQWRFQPATEDGNPVATSVTQTLVFNPPLRRQTVPEPPPRPTPAQVQTPPVSPPHNDAAPTTPKIEPISIVAPQYPPKAYRRGIGGQVTVRFTIGTDGRTHHIQILAAKPQGTFNNAARLAVRQWRFKPVAKPVEVTQTITFNPPGK